MLPRYSDPPQDPPSGKGGGGSALQVFSEVISCVTAVLNVKIGGGGKGEGRGGGGEGGTGVRKDLDSEDSITTVSGALKLMVINTSNNNFTIPLLITLY